VEAEHTLGSMLAFGRDTPRDVVEGGMWLELALQGSDRTFKVNLKRSVGNSRRRSVRQSSRASKRTCERRRIIDRAFNVSVFHELLSDFLVLPSGAPIPWGIYLIFGFLLAAAVTFCRWIWLIWVKRSSASPDNMDNGKPTDP
jgi:hypothetical protein